MDQNIRGHWLLAFCVFHIGLYTIGALDQIFGEYLDGFPRGFYIDTSRLLYKWLLIFPMCHLIIAGVTYYFSYIKRGVKWILIFMLGLGAVSLLYLRQFIDYSLHDWSFVGTPVGLMIYQIAVVYLSAYYLFNCYRLYSLNCGEKSFGQDWSKFIEKVKSHVKELV